MKQLKLVNVFLLLATVFVLVINNINPIEAVRALKTHDYESLINRDNHPTVLLSSLQRGTNPPSSPNPIVPSTIDDRAFAGHAIYHHRHHYIPLLASLPKGDNPPSSPNPVVPLTIDGRAFAGHAVYRTHLRDIALLSSLPRGGNPPSTPNPVIPSSIDDKAFAGHAMYHHHHPPPPRAEFESQGLVFA